MPSIASVSGLMFAGPCAVTMPRLARRPRNALMSCVVAYQQTARPKDHCARLPLSLWSVKA